MRSVRKLPAADDTPRLLHDLLAAYPGWNVFNPSVHVDDSGMHLVFRAYRDGVQQKPFNAYYVLLPSSPADAVTPLELTDLTAHVAASGVPVAKVADPKLFAYRGATYLTFNTGSSPEPNDVYVMPIAPTLGTPQRCVLEPRLPLEKNWGFFDAGDGLRALYGLSPVSEIALVDGVPGAGGDLVFEHAGVNATATVNRRWLLVGKRNLSIGTQPLPTDRGLLVIGHEKIYASKWRGYVGRVVLVERANGSAPRATVLPHRLIHSIPTSVPRIGRHNPSALFVTYFAGLTRHDGRLLVSYGINDTDYGFAQLPEELVTPPAGR